MKKKGKKVDTSANTLLINDIIKNSNSAIIKNNLQKYIITHLNLSGFKEIRSGFLYEL